MKIDSKLISTILSNNLTYHAANVLVGGLTLQDYTGLVELGKLFGNDPSQWPNNTQESHQEPPLVRTDFSELTEDDVTYITELYGQKMPEIQKYSTMYSKYGIAERTSRGWFNKLGLTNAFKEIDLPIESKNRSLTPTVKRYFFTSAQNNTPIHSKMWKSMLTCASKYNAEIHVIPYRYKNPTSRFPEAMEDNWAEEILPHLDATDHQICDNLKVLGALKVQPTASYPLDGLHAAAKGQSVIVGHPKMHLICQAVLDGLHKQKFWSTGSVTVENYTDSKAGYRGNAHHQFGFIIVEIDVDGADGFHVRHVPVCADGTFQDLRWKFDGDTVESLNECLVARWGDLHWNQHDENAVNAALKFNKILKPTYLVLDDVFNGSTVNHHEFDDKVKYFHSIKEGKNLLQSEIDELLGGLQMINDSLPTTKLVIVQGNHDLWLDKYIRTQDWKKDVPNAQTYSKCLNILLERKGISLLPHFIREKFGDGIECLTTHSSFKPGAYEHGYHGHLGINGSRGSVMSYAKMQHKTTMNHLHTHARIDGCLCCGTMTVYRMGYNEGASNWSQGMVIEYTNGQSVNICFDANYRFTTLLD